MADENQEARELFSKASGAYQGGNATQALQLLEDAIGMVSHKHGAQQRAFFLLQKAGWLRECGRAEEGATTLNEAAHELNDLPRTGHETEWSSLRMEQGLAARQRGDFGAAESLLDEARTLAEQSPARDLLLTDVYANQAAVYLHRGRLSDAQDVLLAALEIDQRVGNKRSESNDLNMLGLVYGRLGDVDTSRAYLTKAFEVAYQNSLTHEAMDAMTNLGALTDDAGDHADATNIFENIKDAGAEGGDKSRVACSVANQGVAAAQAGDLDHAASLFARSRELHLAAGNSLHSIHDLLNLSGVEQQRGNLDHALSYAKQALAATREYGLIELQWAAEYTVARCYRLLVSQAGNSAEKTGIEAAEEALAGYRRAADVIELLRSNVDRPEERESLLTDKEAIYDEAILLSLALGRAQNAFQFCERARMRSFLEDLGSQRLERLEVGDPALDRRRGVEARLLSPLTSPAEKPGLMDDLRTIRAEIIARRPALAAITEAELPTEDDIRANIPPETCVLEYYQVGNTLIIFILDRDGLQDCCTVQFEEPLADVIRRFRDEIDSSDLGLMTGHDLFAALLRPVMPRLETTQNLIVVPHGSLHYVPFSALWYKPAGDDAPARQYLKNRFFLTTIPSASYLPYLMRTTAPDREYGPARVLGNPSRDLPGAEEEARRIAARLGVDPMLQVQATREALLDAGHPTVLHVACHGSYNEEDPLLSGLQLADGIVTVEDLLSAGPAPRLLVLSGCVTGISQRKPGDELVGLAQAALRCGTQSVIATLWETFDESSTVFFERCYEALIQGARVSEAIAWGREALATGPGGFDHPVDWAPFFLIGDPNQRLVELDQAPMAQFNRAVRLFREGDTEGAKAIFQRVSNSSDPEVRANAVFSLGMLLNAQGDKDGALHAWRQAADSGNPTVAPSALYGIGGILEDRGDPEGARAIYERVSKTDHPRAALATLNIGAILVEQGDTPGAVAAFQRAIDSNHPEATPKAALNLGNLLVQQGDVAAARVAYQRAIDTGDEEISSVALHRLEELLGRHS